MACLYCMFYRAKLIKLLQQEKDLQTKGSTDINFACKYHSLWLIIIFNFETQLLITFNMQNNFTGYQANKST